MQVTDSATFRDCNDTGLFVISEISTLGDQGLQKHKQQSTDYVDHYKKFILQATGDAASIVVSSACQ